MFQLNIVSVVGLEVVGLEVVGLEVVGLEVVGLEVVVIIYNTMFLFLGVTHSPGSILLLFCGISFRPTKK